jgi:hypothetical protein
VVPVYRRFDSFRIDIRSRDHSPPHVHVVGPGFHALIRISNLEIMQGTITRRAYAEVLEWANRTGVQAALLSEWERLNERD